MQTLHIPAKSSSRSPHPTVDARILPTINTEICLLCDKKPRFLVGRHIAAHQLKSISTSCVVAMLLLRAHSCTRIFSTNSFKIQTVKGLEGGSPPTSSAGIYRRIACYYHRRYHSHWFCTRSLTHAFPHEWGRIPSLVTQDKPCYLLQTSCQSAMIKTDKECERVEKRVRILPFMAL